MSLITRCPVCSTLFKVVPDQLRISGGWVCCGHCREVFDANEHLMPQETVDSAPPPPPSSPPPPPSSPPPPPPPPPPPALAPEEDEVALRIPDAASLLRQPEGAAPAPGAALWSASELQRWREVRAQWAAQQDEAARAQAEAQALAQAQLRAARAQAAPEPAQPQPPAAAPRTPTVDPAAEAAPAPTAAPALPTPAPTPVPAAPAPAFTHAPAPAPTPAPPVPAAEPAPPAAALPPAAVPAVADEQTTPAAPAVTPPEPPEPPDAVPPLAALLAEAATPPEAGPPPAITAASDQRVAPETDTPLPQTPAQTQEQTQEQTQAPDTAPSAALPAPVPPGPPAQDAAPPSPAADAEDLAALAPTVPAALDALDTLGASDTSDTSDTLAAPPPGVPADRAEAHAPGAAPESEAPTRAQRRRAALSQRHSFASVPSYFPPEAAQNEPLDDPVSGWHTLSPLGVTPTSGTPVDFVLSDIGRYEDFSYSGYEAPRRPRPSAKPPPRAKRPSRTDKPEPRASKASRSERAAPSFVAAARRRAFWSSPPVRRGLWAALALLTLTLLAQALISQRDGLAARHPQLTPLLNGLCQPLGCQVRPYRDLDAVVIDSSTFHRAGPAAFAFSVTLRNRARWPVATPALELTLTNAADQPVLRRVISVEEMDAPQALQARGEFNATRTLALRGVSDTAAIVGYRLVAFYP